MFQAEMNWGSLYFGKVSPKEVQEAIKDPKWQSLRSNLKGASLLVKYRTLKAYYLMECERVKTDEHALRMLQVRVTNYVTALSRGGLIKPEDYRDVY